MHPAVVSSGASSRTQFSSFHRGSARFPSQAFGTLFRPGYGSVGGHDRQAQEDTELAESAPPLPRTTPVQPGGAALAATALPASTQGAYHPIMIQHRSSTPDGSSPSGCSPDASAPHCGAGAGGGSTGPAPLTALSDPPSFSSCMQDSSSSAVTATACGSAAHPPSGNAAPSNSLDLAGALSRELSNLLPAVTSVDPGDSAFLPAAGGTAYAAPTPPSSAAASQLPGPLLEHRSLPALSGAASPRAAAGSGGGAGAGAGAGSIASGGGGLISGGGSCVLPYDRCRSSRASLNDSSASAAGEALRQSSMTNRKANFTRDNLVAYMRWVRASRGALRLAGKVRGGAGSV